MAVPLYIVDAFTDRPFGGNPAGVCLLGAPTSESWMAAVATEVNLSETAFVWPVAPDRWGLRWWTPKVEVPLCGHATLAAAHILLETGGAGPGATMTFATASGDLTARPRGGAIQLDFPAYSRSAVADEDVGAARALVGIPVSDVVAYGGILLALVADRTSVEGLAPDLDALVRLPYSGLLVTAAGGDAEPGYVLRYFAPAVGIDEDPVTGSAQCAAGPFWRDRTGATTFVAEQLSARRGRLSVTVGVDDRVAISGRAVTVIRGSLTVDPDSGCDG